MSEDMRAFLTFSASTNQTSKTAKKILTQEEIAELNTSQAVYEKITNILGLHHHEGTNPKLELKVFKLIMIREGLLMNLQHLNGKVLRNETIKSSSMEILEILTQLRECTLNYLEALCLWRQSVFVSNHYESSLRLFLWEGQNYTLKIVNDLDFLSENTLLAYSLSIARDLLKSNPLMLANNLEDPLTWVDPYERALQEANGAKGSYFETRLRLRFAERILLQEIELTSGAYQVFITASHSNEYDQKIHNYDSNSLTDSITKGSSLSSDMFGEDNNRPKSRGLKGNSNQTKNKKNLRSNARKPHKLQPLNRKKKLPLNSAPYSAGNDYGDDDFEEPPGHDFFTGNWNQEYESQQIIDQVVKHADFPDASSTRGTVKTNTTSSRQSVNRKSFENDDEYDEEFNEIPANASSSDLYGKMDRIVFVDEGSKVERIDSNSSYHSLTQSLGIMQSSSMNNGERKNNLVKSTAYNNVDIDSIQKVEKLTPQDLKNIISITHPPSILCLAASICIIILSPGKDVPTNISWHAFIELCGSGFSVVSIASSMAELNVQKVPLFKLKAVRPYLLDLQSQGRDPNQLDGMMMPSIITNAANSVAMDNHFNLTQSVSTVIPRSDISLQAWQSSHKLIEWVKQFIASSTKLQNKDEKNASKIIATSLFTHQKRSPTVLKPLEKSSPNSSLQSSKRGNPSRTMGSQRGSLTSSTTSSISKLPNLKTGSEDLNSANKVQLSPINTENEPSSPNNRRVSSQSGQELWPYHTELLEDIYRHPLLLALLTSASTTSVRAAKTRAAIQGIPSTPLFVSSSGGIGKDNVTSSDRLVAKLFDVVSSYETQLNVNIREFQQYQQELIQLHGMAVANYFVPEDLDWWAKYASQVFGPREKTNGEIQIIVKKKNIENIVMACISKREEELKVSNRDPNSRYSEEVDNATVERGALAPNDQLQQDVTIPSDLYSDGMKPLVRADDNVESTDSTGGNPLVMKDRLGGNNKIYSGIHLEDDDDDDDDQESYSNEKYDTPTPIGKKSNAGEKKMTSDSAVGDGGGDKVNAMNPILKDSMHSYASDFEESHAEVNVKANPPPLISGSSKDLKGNQEVAADISWEKLVLADDEMSAAASPIVQNGDGKDSISLTNVDTFMERLNSVDEFKIRHNALMQTLHHSQDMEVNREAEPRLIPGSGVLSDPNDELFMNTTPNFSISLTVNSADAAPKSQLESNILSANASAYMGGTPQFSVELSDSGKSETAPQDEGIGYPPPHISHNQEEDVRLSNQVDDANSGSGHGAQDGEYYLDDEFD